MSRSSFLKEKQSCLCALTLGAAIVMTASGCRKSEKQKTPPPAQSSVSQPDSQHSNLQASNLQPKLIVGAKDVEPVQAMQFSRDGETIMTGHSKTDEYGALEKGTAALWNTRTGRLENALHSKEAILAYSPDAKTIAVMSQKGGSALELWDVRTGKLKRTVDGGSYAVFAAAFSPNGKLLVDVEGGDDISPNAIVVWDVATGKMRKALGDSHFLADQAIFSADSETVIAAGTDPTTPSMCPMQMHWDVRTGKLTSRKQAKNRSLPAVHQDNFVRAAYPSNRKVRLSKTHPGSFQISDTATKKSFLTFVLFSRSGKVKAADDWIAYTPEGYYDGSAGATQRIRWRLGDELQPGTTYQSTLHRPDIVRKALQSTLNHSVSQQTIVPSHSSIVLTEKALKGKSARELDMMRNEIFARRGRRFRRRDLQKHLEAQPWYKPRADYHDGLLSEREKRNAEFILEYQRRNGE